MGVIRKELEVASDKGQARAWVVFDSGSSRSFIRRALAKEFATIFSPPGLPPGSELMVTLGDGEATFSTREFAHVALLIGDTPFWHIFWVADKLADEVIAGADFLQIWKIKLDPEKEAIVLDPWGSKAWLI